MSQRKRPMLLVAAVAGVVLAGGGAVIALTHKRAPEPNQLAVPAAIPTHEPPATPAHDPPTTPTAPAAPVAARIQIRATPASAQLLLDDAPVSNPFSGQFPRGELRHRLVAKAPGYRTESEWLTFDGDRDVALTLTKGSGTHERDRNKTPTAEATPPTRPAVDEHGKAIYKGTKGKLITDFPE